MANSQCFHATLIFVQPSQEKKICSQDNVCQLRTKINCLIHASNATTPACSLGSSFLTRSVRFQRSLLESTRFRRPHDFYAGKITGLGLFIADHIII